MRTISFLTILAVSLFSLNSFSYSAIKSAVLFDGRLINLRTDVLSIKYNHGDIDYLELQSGEVVDRTDIRTLILHNKLGSQNSRSRIGIDGGGM